MSTQEINFDTYNDFCTECTYHDRCHKNGIDYDKIALCVKELEKTLSKLSS